MCLQSFENTVGKGKIARNEQFFLFPQCFLPFWKTFSLSHQTYFFCLQTLSPWKSLKFVIRERIKRILYTGKILKTVLQEGEICMIFCHGVFYRSSHLLMITLKKSNCDDFSFACPVHQCAKVFCKEERDKGEKINPQLLNVLSSFLV